MVRRCFGVSQSGHWTHHQIFQAWHSVQVQSRSSDINRSETDIYIYVYIFIHINNTSLSFSLSLPLPIYIYIYIYTKQYHKSKKQSSWRTREISLWYPWHGKPQRLHVSFAYICLTPHWLQYHSSDINRNITSIYQQYISLCFRSLSPYIYIYILLLIVLCPIVHCEFHLWSVVVILCCDGRSCCHCSRGISGDGIEHGKLWCSRRGDNHQCPKYGDTGLEWCSSGGERRWCWAVWRTAGLDGCASGADGGGTVGSGGGGGVIAGCELKFESVICIASIAGDKWWCCGGGCLGGTYSGGGGLGARGFGLGAGLGMGLGGGVGGGGGGGCWSWKVTCLMGVCCGQSALRGGGALTVTHSCDWTHCSNCALGIVSRVGAGVGGLL